MAQKEKFKQNLLKLSRSKDITKAKNEWLFLFQEEREDGICICGHKIKNNVYMYNPKTNKTISVGVVCHKKFELEYNGNAHRLIRDVFMNFVSRGEYEYIDDIELYVADVERKIRKYISEQCEMYSNNLFFLKNLENDVTFLIENYGIKYLRKNLANIKATILNYENTLKKKQEQEEELKRKQEQEEEEKRKKKEEENRQQIKKWLLEAKQEEKREEKRRKKQIEEELKKKQELERKQEEEKLKKKQEEELKKKREEDLKNEMKKKLTKLTNEDIRSKLFNHYEDKHRLNDLERDFLHQELKTRGECLFSKKIINAI